MSETVAGKRSATIKCQLSAAAIKQYAGHLHVEKLKDQARPQLYFRYHSNRVDGTYWLVVRIPGLRRPSWIRIGYSSELSASKARALATKMVAERCYRNTPDLLKAAAAGRFVSVDQLLMWYLSYINDLTLTLGRKEQIKQQINKHLLPYFGNVPMSELSAERMTKLAAYLLQTQCLSESSARKVLSVLFSACKRANKLRILEFNLLAGFSTYSFIRKAPNEKFGREMRMNFDWLPHIFRALHEHANYATVALVQLSFLTWGRIAEVSQARWDGWSQIDGTLKVTIKGGAQHLIYTNPIIDQVLANLRRSQRDRGIKSAFMFPHRDRFHVPRPAGSASQSVRLFAKERTANVWSAHDIRKFANDWSRENGIDAFVCERLLSHEQTDVSYAYNSSNLRDARFDALDRWAKVLCELGLLDKRRAISSALAHRRVKLRSSVQKIMRERN